MLKEVTSLYALADSIYCRMEACHILGKFNISIPPYLDLFATCLNKLPVYVSPVPDPLAQVDALSMNWEGIFAYPPWSLLDRVLKKIEQTDCLIILIAPAWQNRSWFLKLFSLMIEDH